MTLPDGLKGSMAAISAVAAIMAAVVGGWLSGHWLWAPACGFLVLIAVVAGVEAVKARTESNSESTPAEQISLSGNASLGDTLIAGGDINQSKAVNNIDQSKTTNFRGLGGIAAIIVVLASAGAIGGTAYISAQPDIIGIESPQSLANDAGHNSPEAAVKGFFGDYLLDDFVGACAYLLPSEQSTCYNNFTQNTQGEKPYVTGEIGVGNAITSGIYALVPVRGQICNHGVRRALRGCKDSFSGNSNGLPTGMSFQSAFRQAVNGNGKIKFLACERDGNAWYVDASLV